MFQPTVDQIRAMTDATSFARGREYHQEGRIYDAVAVDGVVRARCIGSMDFDYSVELRMGTHKIEAYQCTCPRGGFCKHIVALAFVVIEEPAHLLILESRELRLSLSSRTKDELIDLIINQATKDIPFARTLLKTEPTETPDAPEPLRSFVDRVAEFQREAEHTFHQLHGNPYRAALEQASRMQDLMLKAAHYTRNEPATILAFYMSLYLSIEDHIGQFDDSDGAIGGIAWNCIQEMKNALETGDIDSQAQKEWLALAVPRYLENDYGLGDELGTAISAVRGDEIVTAAEELVHTFLTSQDHPSDPGTETNTASRTKESSWEYQYRRKTAVELLAGLFEKSAREDEVPELYRTFGLHYHYVVSAFQAGREVEALEYAGRHLRNGHDVVRFSQTLIDAGRYSALRTMLKRILPEIHPTAPYQDDVLRIYADTLETLGDVETALHTRVRAFRDHPSVETFGNAMATADRLGREAETDRELVDWCRTGNVRDDTLVEIHMHRNDVDGAIDVYNGLPGYPREHLAYRLALFAAGQRPEESRRLLQSLVELNVSRRDRHHYREAAEIARKLELVMSEEELAAYLTDLRQRFRRLPALQDELNQEFGQIR